MAKSKFDRSLAAHERLFEKHRKNRSNDRSRRLMNYHANVHDKQLAIGRVLSFKERREIYRSWVKPNK